MENSTKGDPRGDVIARGIVSEELARVMYERYVELNPNKNTAHPAGITSNTNTLMKIYRWFQELSSSFRSDKRYIRFYSFAVTILLYGHYLFSQSGSNRSAWRYAYAACSSG